MVSDLGNDAFDHSDVTIEGTIEGAAGKFSARGIRELIILALPENKSPEGL